MDTGWLANRSPAARDAPRAPRLAVLTNSRLFIILRFSNVYGRYDKSDRLIPRSIRRANADEQLEVYGKDKLLDFTFIDDSVSGVIAAIERFDIKGVLNETYNLATGKASTILNVVELINEAFGKKSGIKVTNPRLGEVIKYTADISKARAELGWEPKIAIEQGLAATIEYFRAQPDI